jgi:hypothetical protein
MAEPGGIERKTGKLALARTTFLQILEADGITEAHEVHVHIARKQHSPRTPQQRHMSRAVPGGVNYFDAAGDGQYFPIGQRLVDGDRLQSLVGMKEQLAHHAPRQTRRRHYGPKRTSTFGHGDIERVHVGPGAGFPDNRSGAADMIRVGVSENEAPELIRRTAKPPDRSEDGRLPTRVPSVDQYQPIAVLDQVGVRHPHWGDVHSIAATLHSKESGVCHPHRDDVHSVDHTLHSLARALRTVYAESALIADYTEIKLSNVGANVRLRETLIATARALG